MVDKTYNLDNYTLSRLDELVLKFISILEKYTDYVIVSGYLAIVFGNTRPTMDVDVLFDSFTKDSLQKFLEELDSAGFEYIGPKEELFDILEKKKEKIDFLDKNSNWYFDFKKAKTSIDRMSLEQHDILIINGKYKLNISPIELQIPYKIAKLSSDKDIKDAEYLYSYFANYLDKDKLKEFAEYVGANLAKIKVKL